jgi:YidC/Oxa1 family membrane protein insertase
MDMYRTFLAIILSFLILIGYQYFFVPDQPSTPAVETTQQVQEGATSGAKKTQDVAKTESQAQVPAAVPAVTLPAVKVDANARNITVDTPLYTAVFFEQGGGLKSFILKKYRSELDKNSPPMELVKTTNPAELPLVFTLDNGSASQLPVFTADKEAVTVQAGASSELVMSTLLDNGLKVVRTLQFSPDNYLITSNYTVTNTGSSSQQVSPALTMSNAPFAVAKASSRYMFSGPSVLLNGELEEIKAKKLKEGSVVLQGAIQWAAYEDNYFMSAVIPEQNGTAMVTMTAAGDTIRTVVSDGVYAIAPGEVKNFEYAAYLGPKKLSVLKATGFDLAKAVNFGWFDMLAKPMLFLLNFFYQYIGNYGIAIILLTCLIKGVFWPITHKGMKSMKNMQKLQPKVAKLKEKYKDDPAKMNQEMMAMYKTYKVNPIGGCLPMVLQIPFFFALYRVLMAAIELRHAPFMLWINDLSAPDRLMVGFDIPMLHGIPVLTLLMGASMYLQQKMTPTTADPTQARIMQFLPVVFTFMFINFASGLVLYWFVNNLLSILQQQVINRQTSKA